MSPEEYAALLADGKVSLRRDVDGNFIYDAYRTSCAVLPRDIIQQLESQMKAETVSHEARMKAFDRFISDLKNAK
jgi:hypothetical protein